MARNIKTSKCALSTAMTEKQTYHANINTVQIQFIMLLGFSN